MTEGKRSSAVDEKIDTLEDAVHDVLEGTKESIASAQAAMDRAKATLGRGAGAAKTQALGKAKEYLAEAKRALEAVGAKDMSVEARLKAALRNLAR